MSDLDTKTSALVSRCNTTPEPHGTTSGTTVAKSGFPIPYGPLGPSVGNQFGNRNQSRKKPLSRHRPPKRVSDKRLAAHGGQMFSTITKRSKIKTRNPKRRAREFARAFGSEERVAFVQGLPCCVAGCRVGPCDNAHSSGGGAGRKGDATTVIPLCRGHHREQHQIGAGSFAIRYALNLRALAAATERAWQAYVRGEAA